MPRCRRRATRRARAARRAGRWSSSRSRDVKRVVQHREHARHRRGVEVRGHEVEEELGDVGRRGDQLLVAARRHDLAAQRERAARLERHQVAGGEDAHHLAVVVEHRQVVHAGGHHGDARLGREHAGADGVHRRRHDLGDGGVAGDVADDDLVAQVDVGDDALDALAARAAHEDRRALLGDHDLRGLLRRRLRVAEQRLAARDRRDRQRAHVGQRAHGAGRLQQALAQVGGHPLQARRVCRSARRPRREGCSRAASPRARAP